MPSGGRKFGYYPPRPPLAPLHPLTPPPHRRSCRSDAVLGSACFSGPSLPHRSKDVGKKNQPGLACCYGETPHLDPAPPTAITFTTITTTTTILQHQTSLLYLHCYQPPPPRLFSRALWTVRCCQARAERREAGGREDLQNKSSSVCTRDVTLQRRQRHENGSIALSPSHFISLFMVSLLMCPVCAFGFVFLFFLIGSGTLLFL